MSAWLRRIGALAALLPHVAPASAQDVLKKHAAITGERRPALCATRETVGLVLAVLERAAAARAQAKVEKAKSLYEIAARLQGELCEKPGPEDAVIVRCDLGRRQLPGNAVTLLKVTAVIRSEIDKGEQSFFSWSYQPVEASAGGAADTAANDRRWCSEETADKPVAATPDSILRVQQRLYDIGLHVGGITGQLSPETIRALSDFQRWAKLPATGQLTEATLARLDKTEAPKSWVAIAFDGGGHYGAARGEGTRRLSEAEAVKRLRQRSQADYKVTSSAAPSCIGIATTRYIGRDNGRRVSYTQTFTSIAADAGAARSNVVAYCNQQKGGGTCQLKEAVCAEAATAQRDDPALWSVNGLAPRSDPQQPLSINAPPPRFDPKQPDTTNRPAPIRIEPRADPKQPVTANSPAPSK
ncbi:MAG: peptidoglycan-binding protein [Hyphomicrobiaceae bacterium]